MNAEESAVVDAQRKKVDPILAQIYQLTLSECISLLATLFLNLRSRLGEDEFGKWFTTMLHVFFANTELSEEGRSVRTRDERGMVS